MKYYKILLIVTICYILIQSTIVLGGRPCQSVQEAGADCEVLTPVLLCSTYDMYNPSRTIIVYQATISEINDTGIYNFTFNQNTLGTYKIILCDNTTATIEVADYSYKNIYEHLQANISSLELNLSTGQTDILNNLTTSVSDILSNLSTSTADILLEVDNLEENVSIILANVTSIISDSNWGLTNIVEKVWAYVVGYLNPAGSSLTANQTLVTIAQNTEAGG